jgi:uncharacterized membrane protein
LLAIAAMSGDLSHPEIPPGWDYNPSAWSQRFPIIGLSIVGVVIAGYLAFFQIGVFDSVWEPFFGEGSRKILTSWVSELMHPVPDAALGAFGYLVDAITGAIGSRRRWRTMPWMVVIFGLAIGPLGVVSVLLVILQPVLFDSWCTLCLASGVVSVLMIGPAMDETLASLQHLRRARERGESTWHTFWGTQARSAA